jgi:hypothetical protein
MSWGSSVPTAITALVATFRAGYGTAVPVRDGATVSDSGKLEAVAVAYESEDTPAFEGVFDPYASASDMEEATINCAVRVLKGRDPVAARARAFVLFNQAGGYIKNDRTLGGAVMRAWISTYSGVTPQSRGGPEIVIAFGVTFQAETPE